MTSPEIYYGKQQTTVFQDNRKLYEINSQGTLFLNVNPESLNDITTRIPSTTTGLLVAVIAKSLPVIYQFYPVKAFDRFKDEKPLTLTDILDTGKLTFLDWLKNRKHYHYLIFLE